MTAYMSLPAGFCSHQGLVTMAKFTKQASIDTRVCENNLTATLVPQSGNDRSHEDLDFSDLIHEVHREKVKIRYME